MNLRIVVWACALAISIPPTADAARRRGYCSRRACCVQTYSACRPANVGFAPDRAIPCLCLKDELYTFGSGAIYDADRHENGCIDDFGDCSSPTQTLVSAASGLSWQDCEGPGECDVFQKRAEYSICLSEPVDPSFGEPGDTKFVLPPGIGGIAQILHRDYLEFDAGSRIIRAKVFLIYIPQHPSRPGRPARIIGIGFEVANNAASAPSHKVQAKYVKRPNPMHCHYNVTVGTVTYGIVTTR
jgi:hypothetical protein